MQHTGQLYDDMPPPPPDGSAVVPVTSNQTSALPAPPDGSRIVADQSSGATEVGDEMQRGFADQLPPQVASKLAPEDQAALVNLYKTASANDIARFLESKGFASDPVALAHYVAGRDHAKQTGGKVNYGVTYELPKATDGSDGGAFARGAEQGATLGFGDELHGIGTGALAAIKGDSFGDAYNRTVDQDRAQLGYDEQNHWLASLGGNLVGSAALPFGLEKAGVTSSIRALGAATRDAAIAEGIAPATADRLAARAITHRLAAEGGAYGGAYGTGSSDGDPGQRLVAGAEGAGLGVFLGGVGLPVIGKAGSAVRNGVRNAYDAATGSITNAGALRRASDVLTGSAIRPVEDILNDIASRPEAVTGSYPTLGEVAGDSGLAGLQRGMANSNPTVGASLGERHAQNAIARTAYADEALGAGNPQAIQDMAAGRVFDAQAQTQAQQIERSAAADAKLAAGRESAFTARDTAQNELDAAVARVAPLVDRTATGSAARQQFGDAYAAAKAKTRAAYSDPALVNPQPVSIPKAVFDDVVSSVHDFYGDAGGEMPPTMTKIIDDMAGEPANTRTLTNIDRRLADVAGAARMAGRGQEAGFAQSIRNTLSGYIEQHAPAEYKAALSNAKATRAEQGRIFETGDAASTFARDRYGNPTVGDTTVPARLTRTGPPGGDTADGLIAAIGPEAAEQTMRQELRRAIAEGGVSTQAQANALASRYGEAAKRFPALQSDLNALVAYAGRLDTANASVQAADRATVTAAEKAHINELSAAEQAIKASPMSRVSDPAQDPASFVGSLLRRSDGGRMLSRLANDVADNPDAVNGLRRSLGQYIVDAGSGVRNTAAGDDIPALAKTRKAIATITTRAGNLLTPQQRIALQRVGRELKATNFAMNAGRPSGSDTAQNQAYQAALHFLPLPPSARAGKAVYSAIVSHFSNREQVQNLLTQAVLDPDFAATLLKRPTAAHLETARTRLLGRKAVISSTLIAQPTVPSATQQAVNQ